MDPSNEPALDTTCIADAVNDPGILDVLSRATNDVEDPALSEVVDSFGDFLINTEIFELVKHIK